MHYHVLRPEGNQLDALEKAVRTGRIRSATLPWLVLIGLIHIPAGDVADPVESRIVSLIAQKTSCGKLKLQAACNPLQIERVIRGNDCHLPSVTIMPSQLA